MALTASTQYANRYGLNLKFYAYTASGAPTISEDTAATATVEFANEVSVELTGDTTWATGGRSHANKVAFNDPMTGTMTISTQLLTNEFLALLVGTKASGGSYADTSTGEIIFNNGAITTYYVVTGETVWKDKDGQFYTETIKAFKAAPQRAYNVTYTGEGDPSSMDIVFDLTEDDDGNVFSSKKVAGGSMDSNE